MSSHLADICPMGCPCGVCSGSNPLIPWTSSQSQQIGSKILACHTKPDRISSPQHTSFHCHTHQTSPVHTAYLLKPEMGRERGVNYHIATKVDHPLWKITSNWNGNTMSLFSLSPPLGSAPAVLHLCPITIFFYEIILLSTWETLTELSHILRQ